MDKKKCTCVACTLAAAMAAAWGFEEKEVGTISEGLRAEYEAYRKAMLLGVADLEMQLLATRRNYIADVITEEQAKARQEEIEVLINAEQEKYEALHKELWDRVMDELGVEESQRELNYTIDYGTGVVTTAQQEKPSRLAELFGKPRAAKGDTVSDEFH